MNQAIRVNNSNCLFVRFNWDHTATMPLPDLIGRTFKDLHIGPSESYPTGRRGLAMAHYWENMRNHIPDCIGMLTIDGDVAIDPVDMDAMLGAISHHRYEVVTAPIRLWYEKTWYWAHRDASNELSKVPGEPIVYFSFGFTFIPRELMEGAILQGLRLWCYPYVDESMSMVANDLSIKVYVTQQAQPKHMHY